MVPKIIYTKIVQYPPPPLHPIPRVQISADEHLACEYSSFIGELFFLFSYSAALVMLLRHRRGIEYDRHKRTPDSVKEDG